MLRRAPFLLLPLTAAVLGAACNSEPKLDVHVAGTPTAAPAGGAGAPVGGARPEGGAVAERAAPPISQGAEMPASHPPMAAAPRPPASGGGAVPVLIPGGEGAKALVWTVPKGWATEPPANPTRRAQYRVPGPGGNGECAVFYFGPGQGGDAASNAQRWAGQFEQPDGKSPSASTRTLTIAGMKVLVIETAGTYLSGGMTGPVEKRPGWALLGAVVEGPDANWFFKLTGPKASVDAQRAAFEGLLKSLKRGA